MEDGGQGDSQDKGGDGEQIAQRLPQLTVGQVDAAQQDVPCLGVGKHLPPAEEGVGVHQSGGDGQNGAGMQGEGLVGFDCLHVVPPEV